MPWNALFIPLLSGYLFTRYCYLTSYFFKQLTGYHLLFFSALSGGVFLGIARLLFLFSMPGWFPEWIKGLPGLAREYAPFDYSETFLLTLLLSVFFLLALNYFFRKDFATVFWIAREGGSLAKLLLKAFQDATLLSFTLDNRKVYVGYVSELTYPPLTEKAIRILPALSGYRSADTLELAFTTEYEHIYRDWYEGGTKEAAEDFSIVIPIRQIVSASNFNLEAYAQFFQENQTTT